MPPRHRKATDPLTVQVTLAVGAPICPYGVALECQVPAGDVVRAYQGLVALARAMGEAVELTREELPQADHVPSGGPVSGDDDFEVEESRAPAPTRGVPRKVGF